MLLPREEMLHRNLRFLNCFDPRLHVLVQVLSGNLVEIACGCYAWEGVNKRAELVGSGYSQFVALLRGGMAVNRPRYR